MLAFKLKQYRYTVGKFSVKDYSPSTFFSQYNFSSIDFPHCLLSFNVILKNVK